MERWIRCYKPESGYIAARLNNPNGEVTMRNLTLFGGYTSDGAACGALVAMLNERHRRAVLAAQNRKKRAFVANGKRGIY